MNDCFSAITRLPRQDKFLLQSVVSETFTQSHSKLPFSFPIISPPTMPQTTGSSKSSDITTSQKKLYIVLKNQCLLRRRQATHAQHLRLWKIHHQRPTQRQSSSHESCKDRIKMEKEKRQLEKDIKASHWAVKEAVEWVRRAEEKLRMEKTLEKMSK